MNTPKNEPPRKPRDPDFIGSDVAMRRAAERAHRRAAEAARAASAGGVEHELGEIHWFYYTGRAAREQNPRKSE